MSSKDNPVITLTKEAIDAGVPLEVRKIRELRKHSKKVVTIMTGVFWCGIIVFNIALWVPLPVAVSKPVLYGVAVVILLVAVIVPIVGLRKHKMILELLKVNNETLKKKSVNQKGRLYIDKVKQVDRPFINAEYKLLHGSKWAHDENE